MQVIGNVFLIDCAQKKHLISSVVAFCAAYAADKVNYWLRESLSVVNFSSGPIRGYSKIIEILGLRAICYILAIPSLFFKGNIRQKR